MLQLAGEDGFRDPLVIDIPSAMFPQSVKISRFSFESNKDFSMEKTSKLEKMKIGETNHKKMYSGILTYFV